MDGSALEPVSELGRTMQATYLSFFSVCVAHHFFAYPASSPLFLLVPLSPIWGTPLWSVEGLFLTSPVPLSSEAKEGDQIFPLCLSWDSQGWVCAPGAVRCRNSEP